MTAPQMLRRYAIRKGRTLSPLGGAPGDPPDPRLLPLRERSEKPMDEGVECIWPVAAVLGEGPVWAASDRTLWFVDIKGAQIHAFNESGGSRSYPTPEFAAFVFPTANGGMICGLKSGLYRFFPANGGFELLMPVDADHPSNRLNDGYVDAAG